MKTSHFQTSHFQLILVTIIFISSCVVTSLPSRQKLLPAKIVKTNNGNTQLQRAGKNPFLFQFCFFIYNYFPRFENFTKRIICVLFKPIFDFKSKQNTLSNLLVFLPEIIFLLFKMYQVFDFDL